METKKDFNLDVYEPKKTFFEKLQSISKPLLIIIGIIFLISASSYSTYYLVKKNLKINDASTNIQPSKKIPSSKKISQPKTNNYKPTNSSRQKSLPSTDYSTIKKDLLKDQIIQSLPDNAQIVLKFYNFNSGVRQWEKSFILKKDKITEGDLSDKDMMIFMHSKYVIEFKTKNLCTILKEAQNNNDLGIETTKSKSSLLWKYKNMLSYRDCIGVSF